MAVQYLVMWLRLYHVARIFTNGSAVSGHSGESGHACGSVCITWPEFPQMAVQYLGMWLRLYHVARISTNGSAVSGLKAPSTRLRIYFGINLTQFHINFLRQGHII